MICNVYLLMYICLLTSRLTLMLLVLNWLSLSFFSNSHSNSKWSIVWSLLPQGHVGVSIISKRYEYVFIAWVCAQII